MLLAIPASAQEPREFVGSAVAFSPDGRTVLTGDRGGNARLWNISDGRALRWFKTPTRTAYAVNSVAFSPDGRTALTGSADGIRLWDVSRGTELRHFNTGFIQQVAFSPDGQKVVAGMGDGAHLWDISTGIELKRLGSQSGTVAAIAFSPDGHAILTGGYKGVARLWDISTGTELRQFAGPWGVVTAVAFSPDGRTVVTGGQRSEDHTAWLWNAATGQKIRAIDIYTKGVTRVSFSPDGRGVLIGSALDITRLWDVATGREIHSFSEKVRDVAFSPDGRSVLTGISGDRALLWDIASISNVGGGLPASGTSSDASVLPGPRPASPSTSSPSATASVIASPVLTNSSRLALVIGNSSYANVSTLPNPRRDADAVAASLRGVGFQTVTIRNDMTRAQMIAALNDFSDHAASADWALVYFSGHGLELGGTNYVIPVDAKLLAGRDVQDEAVPLDRLLSATMGARKLHIVILDACRDNPFIPKMRRTVATRSIGRGLARVEPEGATLVVYAARDGQIAYDGDGQNSPFVTSLVKRLAEPNVEINKLFRLVHDDVMVATGKRQEPYVYGALPGEDFFFLQK